LERPDIIGTEWDTLGEMAARARLVPALGLLLALGCRAPARETGHDVTPARAAPVSVRSAEQIRREGNHLVGAASAYLRQHSHNPVDWYPWGPEALALAVTLDRPIFLSIGYVSCHWCHVMEKEVFEQDDVAAFLNEHFISIKVDREERPDLDQVYMDAVQAMTGSGGWPMSVFLTPSLRPFFGGTYFPRDRFLQVIRTGAEQFRSDRNSVENRGAAVYQRIATAEPAGDRAGLEPGEVHAIARQALVNVDETWGGFRGQTKFPTPIKWRLLIDAYRKWGDEDIGRAVRKTLDSMSAGGLRDHVGGGFFRYSTEPTWTVPHFEKMLYDSAQLAALYFEAAAAFQEPRYRAVALDTLDFMLRDMTTESGGFGASFDADAGGQEGSTYVWTPGELRAIFGEEDGRTIATLLGVTDAGNFEGASVPTLRTSASASEARLWQRCRPKLLDHRRRRPQPAFDAKVVTAWNGLAIGALALGYRASGEPRLRESAERAAEAIWRLNQTPDGKLVRSSNGGQKGSSAVLDDYAFSSQGLVELFEATGKPVYLEHAITLVKQALDRFQSPGGGWFLTSGAEQEPLGRRIEVYDGVEPSGNASMLVTLERLAALTGRDDFTELVERAVRSYAAIIRERGIDMAGWADAALLARGPYYEVVIAGTAANLAGAWNGLLPAWAVGVQVGSAGPTLEQARLMPSLVEKHDRNGVPLAFVCVHGACKKPTTEVAQLRRELLVGWTM